MHLYFNAAGGLPCTALSSDLLRWHALKREPLAFRGICDLMCVLSAECPQTSALLSTQEFYEAVFAGSAVGDFHREYDGDECASMGPWEDGTRVVAFTLQLSLPAFVRRAIGVPALFHTYGKRRCWEATQVAAAPADSAATSSTLEFLTENMLLYSCFTAAYQSERARVTFPSTGASGFGGSYTCIV